MPGANDVEVAMIKRRNLHDPAALGGGDYGGVHAAKWQVVVSGDEFRHPEQIGRMDRLDGEAAGGQVSEEADLRLPANTRTEQIDDLGDHEAWDEQRPPIRLQQFPTRRMVRIVAVNVGVQRARVDDQRDRSTSEAMISSIRSEMSVRPL